MRFFLIYVCVLILGTNKLYAEIHNSPQELDVWVKEAVKKTTHFTFNNYDQDLVNMKKFFTQEGYAKFINALNAINHRDAFSKYRKVQSAVIKCTPILEKTIETKGETVWYYRTNYMLLTMHKTEQTKEYYSVLTTIKKIKDNAKNTYGIDQYLVSNGSESDYKNCNLN